MTVREEGFDGRELGTPETVGIEGDFSRRLGVEVFKQSLEDALPLCIRDEDGELVLAAHFSQHGAEHAGQRAAHAGLKARVLPEDGGEQRRTGTRKTGEEVKAGHHSLSVGLCFIGFNSPWAK